jgi:hypothetical protein
MSDVQKIVHVPATLTLRIRAHDAAAIDVLVTEPEQPTRIRERNMEAKAEGPTEPEGGRVRDVAATQAIERAVRRRGPE